MNKTFRSIFFLKSFSTGLMLPIMSLMVIARGVKMANLALVIGIYSLTVILLEFPSGVFCDLAGRKKTFLISCILMLLSLLVILLGGGGMPVFAAAFVIQGTGRAFASGSLDALVMERSMEQGGDAAAAKTSGELMILESAGIAVGSLAGGLLGSIGSRYSANLIVMAGIYILLTLLVFICVKEPQKNTFEAGFRTSPPKNCSEEIPGNAGQLRPTPFRSFRMQMSKSLRFSWSCIPIRILMIVIFFTGIVLFSVETYWQPGLLRLLGSEKIWLMGLVSFLGFGFTALSSQLGARLLQHFSKKADKLWWCFLFLSKLLFAVFAALFGLWLHPALFVCNYALFYFINGGGGVIENTLLSKHTADEMRASVMSLFSLLFQFGALTASGLSGTLLADAGLPAVWAAFGILMAGCTLVVWGFWYVKRKQFL